VRGDRFLPLDLLYKTRDYGPWLIHGFQVPSGVVRTTRVLKYSVFGTDEGSSLHSAQRLGFRVKVQS
jgi:hypothetical protein